MSDSPSRPSDGHVPHPGAAADEDEGAEARLLTAVRHVLGERAVVGEIGTAVLAEIGVSQE
jgi:hypothetical protein